MPLKCYNCFKKITTQARMEGEEIIYDCDECKSENHAVRVGEKHIITWFENDEKMRRYFVCKNKSCTSLNKAAPVIPVAEGEEHPTYKSITSGPCPECGIKERGYASTLKNPETGKLEGTSTTKYPFSCS